MKLDRGTVNKYVRRLQAMSGSETTAPADENSQPGTAQNQPNPQPGSGQNRPNPRTGSEADLLPPGNGDFSDLAAVPSGPPSLCDGHRETIERKLDSGLSMQRIFQDLKADHGFTGSDHSVRRFIHRLGKKTPLPFRRMETAPGEEAQIDFGTAAFVVGEDGKRRRPWMFRIVLSHSRKAYSEVVWNQTTDNFIAAIENAFHYFGGAPKRLVIDIRCSVAAHD